MVKIIIMFRVILIFQVLFVSNILGNKDCKYSEIEQGGATWHMYTKETNFANACDLPMYTNRNNDELRVTAMNKKRIPGNPNGLVCGDCIRVRNTATGKSTVVMIVDFGGELGLDLSPEAFNAIDSVDRKGNKKGNMDVEWQFTTCDDIIGDDPIKYRWKEGSGKNYYMMVSILNHKIPLSRKNAVQVSNTETDPNSWFNCLPRDGANGYWDCSTAVSKHPNFREDRPFYIRIESIDGQVLIDQIETVEAKDEKNFVPSVRGIQFKGCENGYQIKNNFNQTANDYSRPRFSTKSFSGGHNGYPWASNVESIFKFTSPDLVGIMNKSGTASSHILESPLKLIGDVRVQAFDDKTLRVKMEQIRFDLHGNDVSPISAHQIIHPRNLQRSSIRHNDEDFKNFLYEPMSLLTKRGMIKKMIVSQKEPSEVTEIKKLVASHLEMKVGQGILKLLKKQAIVTPFQVPSHPMKVEIYDN